MRKFNSEETTEPEAIDTFGQKEVIDVDYWSVEELPMLRHAATVHEDDHARLTLDVMEIEFKRIQSGGVMCMCCERAVRAVSKANSRILFVNAWTPSHKVEQDDDSYTVTSSSAAMAVCARCEAKGPAHVQEKSLARMWTVWPTALAIRVRHHKAAKEEGTSK